MATDISDSSLSALFISGLILFPEALFRFPGARDFARPALMTSFCVIGTIGVFITNNVSDVATILDREGARYEK